MSRPGDKSTRDGIILGATVGFGFAAFESAGYALVAALTEHGLSLTDLVTTEFLRGLLAPVGHALWTGILGGVLFSRSTREHFAITGRLLAAYVGVSLLHALGDSTPNIAVLVTFMLTRDPLQDQLLGGASGGRIGLFVARAVICFFPNCSRVLALHLREARPGGVWGSDILLEHLPEEDPVGALVDNYLITVVVCGTPSSGLVVSCCHPPLITIFTD